MSRLTEEQIRSRLAAMAGWSLTADGIRKTYTLPDFRKAIAFVDAVAAIAENRQHHPDIDIRYNQVTLNSVSHDAGGVTERDLDLAAQIEQIRIQV